MDNITLCKDSLNITYKIYLIIIIIIEKVRILRLIN